MNATNRMANRIILFIIGLLLIAASAAAVVASAWPVAADLWRDWLSAAVDWMRGAEAASRVSEATSVSWLVVGVLCVLVAIVLFAVAVIARLGGGQSGTVIRDDEGRDAQGPVTIRHGFASDAITQSLAKHDEILSSRVNARRVRGENVLHVSITPRQTTSPVDAAATVARLVDNLAVLTGVRTPVFVSIRSGVRARLAADRARVR